MLLEFCAFRCGNPVKVRGFFFKRIIDGNEGHRCGGGKFLGMCEQITERTTAAHGQSRDVIVFRIARRREPVVDQRHQFIEKIVESHIAEREVRPVFIVRIEP